MNQNKENPNINECPNCESLRQELSGLRRENEGLRRENEELKKRLDRIESELRDSKRQAAPFSKSNKKKQQDGLKGTPGRKKGKGKFEYRPAPTIVENLETFETLLDRCPDCGGEVTDCNRHESFQEDLEIRKVTTKFITHSGYCKSCQKRVRSRHPEQISTATGSAGTFVGPTVKSLGAQMKHHLGVPFDKISRLLQAFGFSITGSGLYQSNRRLAEKSKPLYESLCQALQSACCVGADETGWRIGTLKAWLWVFTNKEMTIYHIDQSRSHEVVVNILGRDFKGILHADCFSAYDHKDLKDWIQQKCFAHLLKDLDRMEKEKTRGAVRFPRTVAGVLRDATPLRKEKSTLTSLQFVRRRNKIEKQLDSLIGDKRRFSDKENARFAKRLRKQRHHLFRFLHHDEAETTNNQSERMLRPAVISRKTGGCNKTHKGAETHAILASLLATAYQQGIELFSFLMQLFTSPNPPPDLLVPQFS